MSLFNPKQRKGMIDVLLGDGERMTLGLYDASGVRRYWLRVPEMQVADGKLIITGIPPLTVDETFVVGWLQFDNTRRKSMLRVEITPKGRTLNPGDQLHLGNVTVSID